MIKYWFKILYSDNCIINTMYALLLKDIDNSNNWARQIKDMLYRYGYVWENPYTVNSKTFVPLIKQRLVDNFTQEWNDSLMQNSVLTVYKHLKSTFGYEEYLNIVSSSYYRKSITRLRLSSHRLRIESGRYGRNRIDRAERVCQVCGNGEVEDEFHFLLVCDKYSYMRRRYISVHYTRRPSMWKLIDLLSSVHADTLSKLACFVTCALKVRTNVLNA